MMINAVDAAKYISVNYKKKYNDPIDEMKLHKLLYFGQRESLIHSDHALFQDIFHGWRFGPVIPEIRKKYNEIIQCKEIILDAYSVFILDETLARYGEKDSWSLSRLSHGEYSWQKSREGISEHQNGNRVIPLDDIRLDAKKMRDRRNNLNRFYNIG